jgi:amino acid adenylation domain-containing protein
MSPAQFIQSPVRWLKELSRTRATISGGPNFAYELCLQKVMKEDIELLDLSNWKCAFTGAEPIQAGTLRRFADVFEPCGFRYKSFYPCYGLAESTLLVSGAQQGGGPQVHTFHAKAIEEGRIESRDLVTEEYRPLVSSGQVLNRDPRVMIVDPASCEPCEEDRIGEIWVTGKSVAKGYWNRKEQSQETFSAFLSGTGDGPFLRTGDLGFIHTGELFVTGRLKDLIILRGRNFYPQDIEYSVSQSHPAVGSSNGAAFTVNVEDEERLVVVHEMERTYRKKDPVEIFDAIRQAISEQTELQAYAIVLIKPTSIHKTSSGKIQRSECRRSFLEGTLEVIAEYHENQQVVTNKENDSEGLFEPNDTAYDFTNLLQLTEEERINKITSYISVEAARVLKSSDFKADISLQALGFDSLKIVELKARMEEVFEIDIPFDSLLDGPTLMELSVTIERLLRTSQKIGESIQEQIHEIELESDLSVGQRALWFIQKFNRDTQAYYITKSFRILHGFNQDIFNRSVHALLDRHPLLRSSIKEVEEDPLLRFEDDLQESVITTDLTGLSEEERLVFLEKAATKPIDLQKGPLFSVQVFTYEENQYLLMFKMHHIIGDFWSFAILAKEFIKIYSQMLEGKPIYLPDSKGSYQDYVYWQRKMLDEEWDSLYRYWEDRLRDLEPLHLANQLETSDQLSNSIQFTGRRRFFNLSKEASDHILLLAKEAGVSQYSCLLSVFLMMLHRNSGKDDLAVGSPSLGRLQSRFLQTIGYFVNPVVLRHSYDHTESFIQLMKDVHKQVTDALKHQEYPFPYIVERMKIDRSERHPLFNVMFSMHSTVMEQDDGLVAAALSVPQAQVELGPLKMEVIEIDTFEAQFDLTLTMGRVDGQIHGCFEYDATQFDEESINRMVEHFLQLLDGSLTHPEESVARLSMLTDKEVKQQLIEWNETNKEWKESGVGVHEVFEKWASTAPERTAVVYGEQTVSYGELNRQANQLAHRLQSLGVGPDMLVGICLERSPELVAGVIAVLKAGGAYVPLDPALPKERLESMMEQAGLKALLTKKTLIEGVKERDLAILCLDKESHSLKEERKDNPESNADENHKMYVIYTSGSTGTPKGASVYRRGFTNLVQWYTQEFEMTDQDRVLMITSPSFDLTQKNIFAPLMTGGQLVLLPTGPYDAAEVVEMIRQNDITLLNGTPSMFYPLLDETSSSRYRALRTLRYVFLGGEPIAPDRLIDWTTSQLCQAEVVNTYGPTECTDVTVYARLRDMPSFVGKPVPIGRPVPNTRLYILNEGLGLVPTGTPGELCIAGVQVGGGYIGDEGKTAEKFVSNPYGGENASVLYRTGDIARYRQDGMIEYLGRMDDQVKIRGYRIELGEIEVALRECGNVKDAVVMAREDRPGDKRLVAYIVLSEKLEEDHNAVWREELLGKLPEYMVPYAFMVLEKLPFSPNGKVDRKALPAPEKTSAVEEGLHTAPRNEMEQTIAAIWSAVLQVEKVGIHDNFFQLGGHSLLVTQVASRIRSAFNVELQVQQIFETPTIAELVVSIQSQAEKLSNKPAKPKITKLSREQHRLR